MTSVRESFYILAEKLRPAQMTDILELQPDHTALRGEERVPPRARPKKHSWSISAEGIDVSIDSVVSELLRRLLAVPPKLSVLRSLDASLETKIGMAMEPFDASIPIFLTAITIRQLANLGTNFGLEYFADD